MILEIQHETRLDYTGSVCEWLSEVRMEPISDERQSCHSFHLQLSQPTPVFQYLDGFGNRVHHFNLLAAHRQVTLLAASIVETSDQSTDLMSCQACFPLALESASLETLHFLSFRGPVTRSRLLEPLLERLTPRPGSRVGPWICHVGETIRSKFQYAPDVTDSTSPIDHLLEHGKGVCQDFAHLMIAVLRAFGIPTRYVSGYIHRPGQESQSHAWCEAWLPDLGWASYDPTNGCPGNERFVKVATGRDFTDVPPNKGIYRGEAEETISVRVGTRQLERLPSLSWHERLPALDLPLLPVARHYNPVESDEQIQQQQQQQQQQ